MLEAAPIIGGFSAVLLVAAIAAWVKLLRGPPLQSIDGRPAASRAPAELAAQILALAFVLSAVAVVLAIVGWLGR